MSIKEVYFIENGKRKGPISVEDIKFNSISLDTLIWYEGLTDWKKFSEIEELRPYEIIKKTPPKIPNSTEKTIENFKLFTSNFWNLFRNKLKYILILFFTSVIVIFFINFFSNYFYNLYKNNINNHFTEFAHSKSEYCNFNSLPPLYEKSDLFYSNDVSPYSYSKEKTIKYIKNSDSINYIFLTNYDSSYHVEDYIPQQSEQVLEIYESIRCLQHNRSLNYKKSEFNSMLRNSVFLSVAITTIFTILMFFITIIKASDINTNKKS